MALPSGYNRLEYIQSSGTQYIDTRVSGELPLSVSLKMRSGSGMSSTDTVMCGVYQGSSGCIPVYMYQGKWVVSVGSVTDISPIGYLSDNTDYVVDVNMTTDAYEMKVNGTNLLSGSISGGGNTNTLYLFARHDGNGVATRIASGRIYYCKIYKGSTLVRNFVPCQTPSGEIGLWDDANGVFYANAGTGTFTAGPVANDGRLEYIESSGTQYIDTGFKPNQNTRIIFDFIPVSTNGSYLFGARTSSSSADKYAILHPSGASNIRDDFGSEMSNVNLVPSGQTRIDKNKNVTTIGDVTVTHGPASFSSASLFLFANNTGGTAGSMTSVRLLACQIYDNGTLVRDYIPYRYNGEVGLWDRVSNTFYGNSGSGVFTAGPEAVYERVEYIQSSGTQYVDTGFVPGANTRVTSVFQMVSPGTANECIFGVVGQFSFRWYGSGGYFRSNGANNVNFATTIPPGVRHTVTKTPTTCTIDNVYTVTNTVGTVTSSLYIFAQRGASAPTAYAKVKVFSFRVFDGDALVRDFVPVVRSDGTAGLYDQLNEIFYENAGTGTFVAGPVAKYAQVEYLESTGTQYIDTEFYPKYNSRVVVDLSGLGTQKVFVFGARDTASSTAANQFDVIRESPTNIRTDYFGTNKSLAISDATGRTVIDKNANVTTMFGSTITNTPVSSGQCANSLFLFTANDVGEAFSPFASYKLYSCQIYDNGTLVREFVPAVRADGTPGLLDRTNNAFYTNSGTGTFVVGPDLDYTKLEYIESSGTQYVDTGFKPNNNTRLTCGFEILATASSWRAVFGARDSGYTACFAIFASPDGQFQSNTGNGNSSYLFGDAVPVVGYHDADVNKNTTTIDGVSYTHAPVTFQNQIPLYLFADNEGGTASFFIAQKLRYCQIYDNGTLVRDYIPVLRGNGQIGLVDLVSGLFYANAGSGVFIAGPEIIDPDPPEPPGPYEPPSFTEQTLAYLAALRYPFYKLCRLRFLQPDGSTAFSLDNNPKNRRSGAFIADGSISANLQNGKRRNATVTLSNLDSSFDYNVNTVWFGTEIAIDEGLVLPDGSEYYIQQGVFAIENPTEAVEPANRTATYNLVDKWSYLDGTLFGNLESTYEVPVGTNIFQPIQAILALDRGNGQAVDGVTPIFTEYYNSKTQSLPDGSTANLVDSPYTLRIDSDNGTYADVLLGLAAMVNAWIGYDQTGALRIDPSQDDILDTNKPILWQFSMDEATFLGANYTVRNVDVYNDYIVLGELLDDNSQPAGRATNLDPRSDTNVQTIGRKTFRMSAPGFATDKQCQDLAVWKLKRSTSLQKAISISCSQLFHIEENGLVTIVRTDKPGSPVERHLVMGFTRPLTSNGEMQINAVSVQDFVTATVTSWPE